MKGICWRLMVLLSGVLLLVACSEEPERGAPVVQPVKVIVIGGPDATVKREFPATVRASERAQMAFQVPGKLVELPVKEGQSVSRGDLLARLDDADYQANLAAARAAVTQTEGNFRRAQELIEKNYVSQAEFDKIRADYDVARSNLAKAEKAVRDTRLEAPFDGVVARILVDNFQEVQAKSPVASLQNNAALELLVNVPESLILKRDENAAVDLYATFEAIPGQRFDLAIKEFATEADPATQTFQYVMSLQGTGDHNLLPGMTASVHVAATSARRGQRVLIPLSALVAGADGGKSVWRVANDNTVSRVPVSVGELSGDDSIAVLSGLETGDQVVVAGTSMLVDGMAVKPVSTIEF